MEKKKNIGLGFYGYMLLIFQAAAFFTQIVFTNYPMNILADFYGGATLLPKIFTAGTLCAIVFQLIMSKNIGKIKSIKRLTTITGAIALIMGCVITFYPPAFGLAIPYLVCFFLESFFVVIYCTFACSILTGQWFPRRKGTIMGIATLVFPIGNGLLGTFAGQVFKNGAPDPKAGFLPCLIICIVGWLIGVIFVKDFPEQVGAYRDNDRSFTPEMAKQMMEEEIENRKTTVWGPKHTFANRDFWFASVTCGLLLMFSVGMMTQSSYVLASYDTINFGFVMMLVMVFGIIGSYVLGVIDTAIGTKKAMIIAVVIMVISGAIGAVPQANCLVVAMLLLAVFMGASSNFTVSVAAQYWRREDFPSVFSCLNPVANIFNAFAPTVVAMLIYSFFGYRLCFIVIAIAGVVGVILMLLFSKKHVKKVDDKYREAAGKPLDEELATRK